MEGSENRRRFAYGGLFLSSIIFADGRTMEWWDKFLHLISATASAPPFRTLEEANAMATNHPSEWPTVETQLAESKVVHGSALEKLIRDNQDFAMLRPEEAHDRRRLPPWLRVYWRKQHPDAVYAGPSGGYPLVLEQLHDWMITHQDLPGYDVPGSSPGSNAGGRHGK